jgi:hypothetical protein
MFGVFAPDDQRHAGSNTCLIPEFESVTVSELVTAR